MTDNEIIANMERQLGGAASKRPHLVANQKERATAADIMTEIANIARRLETMNEMATQISQRMAGPEMPQAQGLLVNKPDQGERTVFELQMAGLDEVKRAADNLQRQIERINRSLG